MPELKKGYSYKVMPAKQEIVEIIENEVIGRNDIAFTHSVFAQCFLPQRSLKKGNYRWQISHGKTSLLVKAGELINPDNQQEWEQREVPAGSKARLLFAYINDRAIRTKNPVIDMGSSMREFMNLNGMPVGGKNAKELIRQAKNIAASDILLGVWGDKNPRQDKVSIARSLSFWLEKNPKQGTLWQPEMTLSSDYFKTLMSHKMPLDFRALVGLQTSPRAMDIYAWLSYRMRTVEYPVTIPYKALHPVFGSGIKGLNDFKINFRNAIKEAVKFYPEAKIDFTTKNDCITLFSSPPAIPDNSGSKARRGHYLR